MQYEKINDTQFTKTDTVETQFDLVELTNRKTSLENQLADINALITAAITAGCTIPEAPANPFNS